MPSQFSITIDMSFESELEMVEMEEKVYNACQLIFDNFDNINVKINKDFTIEIDGYQRTINEYSIKQVNIDENKYDF
jgi:hypothetical protein